MSQQPDTASLLIAVLGKTNALALAKAMGGKRLYIPMTGRDTRTMQILGPTALAQLQARWGGKDIRVPTVAAINRVDRNAEIRRLADAGATCGQIAERMGISRQHVWALLRAPERAAAG